MKTEKQLFSPIILMAKAMSFPEIQEVDLKYVIESMCYYNI